MVPRWFRLLVAAQVAAAVVLVILGAHLLAGGAHVAGGIVDWVRHPGMVAVTTPPVALPVPRAAAGPGGRGGGTLVAPDLLRRLNQGAGRTATLQMSVLNDLETAIRDEIGRLIATSHHRGG